MFYKSKKYESEINKRRIILKNYDKQKNYKLSLKQE